MAPSCIVEFFTKINAQGSKVRPYTDAKWLFILWDFVFNISINPIIFLVMIWIIIAYRNFCSLNKKHVCLGILFGIHILQNYAKHVSAEVLGLQI